MGSEQKLRSKSVSLQAKEEGMLSCKLTTWRRGARGIRAKTAEQIGFLIS